MKKATKQPPDDAWGNVFRRHVALGRDHADAAFRADESVKRMKRKKIELQKRLAPNTEGGQS